MTVITTEALVVGSGPGGALTALRLAEAGMSVTVVEEGAWVEHGSVEPFSREEMAAQHRGRGINVALGLPPIAYVEGRCAGGGSEVNSGLWHRPPPELVDRWRERFDIADLDPDDLTARAKDLETMLGVSTVPGPPPSPSEVLRRGAAHLGWDALEVPRVVRYPPDAASYRAGEKQTMTRTLLPRAKGAGAEILTGCRVRRLRINGGRVTGADCDWDQGGGRRPLAIDASHVFVCAGAIQTPALLQRSGVRVGAGRGLKVHPTVKLTARFPDQFDDHAGVAMHQVKEFAPDLTLGGSASRPGYLALGLGDDWANNRADLEDWERLGVYYAAIRSEGSGQVRTIPGLAEPVVTYWVTEGDISRMARGAIALGELLFAAGADRLYPSIVGAPAIDHPSQLVDLWSSATRSRLGLMTIHLLATVRMGERRTLTAADSFGRVWGVKGLHVHDASLVPDAPGVNPQGTIMAIVDRNCSHFVDERARR